MSLRLAGLGWVTPLGSTIGEVWTKLLAGVEAKAATLGESLGEKSCRVFPVPAPAIAEAARHPRLRRSSAISRFAAVAGLSALRDAALELNEASAARTALIFGISNGGVIYTKRFYHEIVKSGAAAASPLLFPETVFNAPASHLAAILGITGASYTVVGDGAVGILALKMAEDLMADPGLDRCLVVGTEEADWLLCDAYRKWRLLRAEPPIEPFARRPKGMILSEGAGAVLLARSGTLEIERIHPGGNFARQREAVGQLDAICRELKGDAPTDLVVASANGTFIDAAERAAIANHFAAAALYTPKPALGESVAAGAIWQLICAAQALRTQRLPTILHAPAKLGLTITPPGTRNDWQRAVVTTCGLNQQVAGLALRR
ncbi:MAG TPA: beta-ketoacyl synthase N-terminal-like domain-containing protein [Chthoniobacterales bacterium]|nr:beta-ketoacyl synthase N-terminal-like domain-containing protein [Chthoniobacterales bacterium]